jgi:hypothetical protein
MFLRIHYKVSREHLQGCNDGVTTLKTNPYILTAFRTSDRLNVHTHCFISTLRISRPYKLYVTCEISGSQGGEYEV